MSPNAINRNDAGAGLHSMGIGQWNRDRLHNLQAFARDHEVDPRNLGTQLAFVEHELQTSEHSTAIRMRGASTVEASTATWATSYERAQGFQYGFGATAGAAGRLHSARRIFSMIGNQNG
jgi:hypothetical protein